MQYAFNDNFSQVYYEHVCSWKTYCVFNCFYTMGARVSFTGPRL